MSGDIAEYTRESDLTLSELARFGERNTTLASWMCFVATDYGSIGDVDKAVSYGRKCLTLPSGWTSWNLRLHPAWQEILDKPQVQALLREFPPR
jgi:hypothetical protein